MTKAAATEMTTVDSVNALNHLALYLHIPFCSAKCGYCDFNSYEHLDHLVPEYTPALINEIDLWAAATKQHTITSIFFGGGTPSLTSIEDLKAIISKIRERFSIDTNAEWTLEANPSELTEEHLIGMRALGINRLSIGVQSMHADELQLLDRQHSAERVVEAVTMARTAGFENLNLDLIFGLIGHSEARWHSTLEQVLELEPEHLSCYALSVEPETALYYQVQKGLLPEPDQDIAAAQYEWTRSKLSDAGYEHYEISNWCQPDRQCRHNLAYWQGASYLGMGAGAHSFFIGQRFANVDAPNRYVDAVNATAVERATHGRSTMYQIAGGETIDETTRRADFAILNLRLLDGIDESAFSSRFNTTLDTEFGAALQRHESIGLIERVGGRTRLTERGLLLANEVFVDLLPEEPSSRNNQPENFSKSTLDAPLTEGSE